MTTENDIICWICTDGKLGMENQCLGLATALNITPIIKRTVLKQPWRPLIPWVRIGLKYAFSKKGADISEPWPDLLIASGRQGSAAALYVKSRHPKTKTVQIQSPGISSHHFDLLVTPRHDNIERFIQGDNVIKTKGALHRVTKDFLDKESSRVTHLVNTISKPRLAVMIGGNSHFHQLTAAMTHQLCDDLLRLHDQEKIGLLVTSSRRTGVNNIAILKARLAHKKNIMLWDDFNNPKNPNPYYGFLGLADAIMVTGDSISMVSEACSTGKPVYIFQLPSTHQKFDVFHDALIKEGITRYFNGRIECWKYAPINDMTYVAERVRALL